LIEPDTVSLTVDGRPYARLKSLMHLSTLIPQEPEIFDNAIEYNITAGITHRTEDVVDAARLAAFEEVVEALPHKYRTHINEKGVNLSGGQKQRLALARGIFAAADSSIILLDEPTSSVDPVNELKIYRNLFRHFASRCVISSVHRLHLLPMFDHIYVLDQGRVVEQGSFGDLLKSDGRLAGMWADYQVNTTAATV
jgi:ABC-type multidrug transport system fused ATPase/permease subunit